MSYLKFATLSALNSFKKSGTEIAPALKTAFLWPNQPRPYEKSWCEWRTAIRRFLAPNVIRANKAHVTPVKTTIRPWIGTDTEPKEHGHTSTHKTMRQKTTRSKLSQRTTLFRQFPGRKINQYSSLDNVASATPVDCTPANAA
jgi:hypothetical protein